MLYVPDIAAAERNKYDEMWAVPEYADKSPGLDNVERFISVLKPAMGSPMVDIGCGTGGAGLALQNQHHMRMWWLDISSAALDPAVPRLRFIKTPLWRQWPYQIRPAWEYGFCCDVLEHIPTEFTMLSIERIVRACRVSWLQISLVPDVFGQAIGQTLHLTVRPFRWWLERIAVLGEVIDARDLISSGLYVVRAR